MTLHSVSLHSADQRLLWIIPQNAGGFGDISCALKIANYLVDNGHFSKDSITIVSTKTDIVSLFNSHAHQVISPEEAQKIHIASVAKLLKFVVPIRCYNNVNSTLLKGTNPYIVLWEYGIKHQPVPAEISGAPHLVGSLGLESDEEGILIDHEILNCSDLSWEKRLCLLDKISPVLRKAILGEGETEKAAKEFITHSRLYFGYASRKDYFSKFLKAIVSYNQGNSKNLVFIFPVTEDKIQLPNNLKNVASIEMYAFDQLNGTISLKESRNILPKGKKITIIFGSLFHSDLKWIQASSKKEMMVTGDQSLSQAISTVFCRFIYENLPHKADLSKSLNKLYPVSPSLELRKGKEAPKSKEILHYFEQCKQQKRKFSEVNRSICQNRNAFTKIPLLIERAFQMQI